MSYLNITIKGLALCRPRAAFGDTQIIFPHPPNHELSVIISEKDSTGTRTSPPKIFTSQFITMTRTGNVTSSTASRSVNYLTNIGRLHRTLSKLSLKAKNNVPIPVSYLSLPTSDLYSVTNSTDKYEIWVHRRKAFTTPTRTYLTVPPHPQGFLAQDVQVNFNIPQTAGEAMTLSAPDIADTTSFVYKADPVPQNKPASYKIVFDNHCNTTRCGSDFGFYYEMLDSVDNGYQVELDEFPLRSLAGGAGDSEAACNPVIGNLNNNCNLETWFRGTAQSCEVQE